MSDKRALSLDLGIPQVPEYAGKEDPLLFLELQRIYNGLNNLAFYLDAYTGRAPLTVAVQAGFDLYKTTRAQYLDVIYAKASVDIPAGSACYTRYNATTQEFTASLASATAADTFCTGFCVSDGGVQTGSLCAIQLGCGLVPYIGALTEGTTYYLSDTPGVISSGPGTNVQKLGYALGPVYFYFTPNPM